MKHSSERSVINLLAGGAALSLSLLLVSASLARPHDNAKGHDKGRDHKAAPTSTAKTSPSARPTCVPKTAQTPHPTSSTGAAPHARPTCVPHPNKTPLPTTTAIPTALPTAIATAIPTVAPTVPVPTVTAVPYS